MELDGIIGLEREVNVVKRGETCINVHLKRNMGGLQVTVKTLPQIEEFFRAASTGETSDCRSIGRYWASVHADTPLLAYNLADPIPIIQIDQTKRARFDWLSRQLVTQGGNVADPDGRAIIGQQVDINLSILRLVGVGEGNGVTFKVKGVYSDPALDAMQELLGEAGKRFYQLYLKPVNLQVAIVTQAW